MNTTHECLMDAYFTEKDISKRSQILKQLLCNLPDDGSMFFLKDPGQTDNDRGNNGYGGGKRHGPCIGSDQCDQYDQREQQIQSGKKLLPWRKLFTVDAYEL